MTAQSIIDRLCKLEEDVEELKIATSSDWKTSYLNSLEIIKAVSAEKEKLETALKTIADVCVVPLSTDAEMYRSWRKIATFRVSVARAALGIKDMK